ncbi:hypothetical protein DEJ44_34180 [Streptomyces venezuelae]|uniref:hypothetical protein n=1 Tax=Streptomyces venezuelae TaxID=54571 RepID=UPI00123A6693|nr:hypothetical protein [Streptomyces venezuelae]QES10177.1 hypothetical protein DEJ44_34180 [Streptomyces venezuelae]
MSHQEFEQQGALPEVMGPEPVVVSGPGAELHLHFPIKVVVAGDIAEEVRDELVSDVYEALHDALS